MKREIALTNARIVLADREIDGTVVLSDGRITRVEEGRSGLPAARDMEGDYLLPGLVELHTDNLEVHLAPRGVRWPVLPALMAHDAQISAAGITTVFDALRIGDHHADKKRFERVREAVDHIDGAQSRGQLRAEHFLHLRCEVTVENVLAHFDNFCGEPLLRLASLMDHTPGQRQFVNMERFRNYQKNRYKLSEAEIDAFIADQTENHNRFAARNWVRLAEACRDLDLRLASHDDATEAHVEEAAELGISISEFPTTIDAARAAGRHGLSTIAGAPNVVCGGSHSGNVAALELAEHDALDALSSDYVPVSLLHSAFILNQELGLSLSEVMAFVSRNPARMVGLEDRGEIAAGKRADLVRVHLSEGSPVVRCVWREGRQVA